jgi:phage terminase large subunit
MPLVVEPGSRTNDPETRPYRPHGALLELFKRRDRELVIEGPADTGKSRGCLEKLHVAMTKYPKARGAIVRKTRKSMTATAMQTFERQVVPEGGVKLWDNQEYRYPNGSKVYLLGLDDPERLKSLEADMVYVQECSELGVDDWEILTSRVTGRGAVMPYVQLLGDMNPSAPNFWLYERETAGQVTFLHARHEDNPSITPERLAALDSLTGYRYKRLRLGLRVAAEGMYFTEWNPELHIVEPFEIPSDWPRWISVDYGFAAPFCALWFARCPETRRIYVYRELYAAGLRDEQQADLIREHSGDERIQQLVLDPSMFNQRGEQQRPSIAYVYAQRGLQQRVVQGIFPGMNNRKQGWAIVRRALAHDGAGDADTRKDGMPPTLAASPARPRLQVLAGRAPNLVRTLPTMVVDPLDPEDVADKLAGARVEDHACDAARYGLCAEAEPDQQSEPLALVWGS